MTEGTRSARTESARTEFARTEFARTEFAQLRTEPLGWAGFISGPWQDGIDVRNFIQRIYLPYLGDAGFLAGATARTTGIWATLSARFPEEQAKGVFDIDASRLASITAYAPATSTAPTRSSWACRRMPPEACHHALRRLTYGRDEPGNPRLPGITSTRHHLHEVTQDPQRRRLRRLPAGRQGRPAQQPDHRTAGCLRPHSHHRRLPPRGPVWRLRAHSRQEARVRHAGDKALHRADHPRPRRGFGADQGSQGTRANGRRVRLRHLPPGRKIDRGHSVALLRLPRRAQRTERCRDVVRGQHNVPRRVHRAGLRRRHAHRGSRSGTDRRPRHQATHRAFFCAPRSTTSSSPATRPG